MHLENEKNDKTIILRFQIIYVPCVVKWMTCIAKNDRKYSTFEYNYYQVKKWGGGGKRKKRGRGD